METLSPRFFSDLVEDDLGFAGDHQFNPFESRFDELDFNSFSFESNSPSYSALAQEYKYGIIAQSMDGIDLPPRPTKQLKTENPLSPHASSSSYPNSNIISLGKPDPSDHYGMDYDASRPKQGNLLSTYSWGKKKTLGGTSRAPSLAQEHVLAERRRREKLSERIIALSALIPGLKKLDKASVLEDAIRYMKELQERVKTLEEEVTMKTAEPIVFVHRSPVQDNGGAPSLEQSSNQFAEIEARVSDKNVLLHIHCEKHRCCIANIFKEIENLNLTIVSHSAVPFGNYIVDITVVARMEADFCLTIDDLIRNLRQALVRIT